MAIPQNNTSLRKERSRRKNQNQNPSFEELFFGSGSQQRRTSNVPSTNSDLLGSASRPERPFGVGLNVNEVKVSEDLVSLEIRGSDSPIRQNEEILNDRLPTLTELNESPVIVDEQKDKLGLNGELSLNVATTLFIDGKPNIFRRPEMDHFGRGESGPVGFAQSLPGAEILSESNEEYFILGKQKDAEVIVAVDTGEPESVQHQRIGKAKERILQGLRQQISNRSASAPKEELGQLAKRANYLQQSRPVVLLPPEDLSPEVEATMQPIKTTFKNGHEQSETIRGFVHIDAEQGLATVARPVAINPAEKGIVVTEVLDGTGLGREVKTAPIGGRGMTPVMRQLVRDLSRPKLTQEEPAGSVALNPTISTRLVLDPYAVPPSFTKRS